MTHPWLDPQGKLVWLSPEWEPHPTEKGWRRGTFVPTTSALRENARVAEALAEFDRREGMAGSHGC